MPYDVFISHSSADKTTADAVCAHLEQVGVRCWIAPRDILPGKSWPESIVAALQECKVMVVVFSSHADRSDQVMREVERAVNKELAIVPFRISDTKPSGTLEYFLSVPHWLDALTPPLEGHIRVLVATVRRLLGEDVAIPPAPPPKPFVEAPPDLFDRGTGVWSKIRSWLDPPEST